MVFFFYFVLLYQEVPPQLRKDASTRRDFGFARPAIDSSSLETLDGFNLQCIARLAMHYSESHTNRAIFSIGIGIWALIPLKSNLGLKEMPMQSKKVQGTTVELSKTTIFRWQ